MSQGLRVQHPLPVPFLEIQGMSRRLECVSLVAVQLPRYAGVRNMAGGLEALAHALWSLLLEEPPQGELALLRCAAVMTESKVVAQ